MKIAIKCDLCGHEGGEPQMVKEPDGMWSLTAVHPDFLVCMFNLEAARLIRNVMDKIKASKWN